MKSVSSLLKTGLFAATLVVATMMMTSQASAQVGIHVGGGGGGGVHWGGGGVHWGGGGGGVHVGGHGGHWGGGVYPGGGIYPGGGVYPGGGHWGGGHVVHRPVWHDTTHVDWHPGGWVQHGGHFDFRQGHYDVHRTGHFDH